MKIRKLVRVKQNARILLILNFFVVLKTLYDVKKILDFNLFYIVNIF